MIIQSFSLSRKDVQIPQGEDSIIRDNIRRYELLFVACVHRTEL